jgi:hypothetical protein
MRTQAIIKGAVGSRYFVLDDAEVQMLVDLVENNRALRGLGSQSRNLVEAKSSERTQLARLTVVEIA